MSDKLTEFEGLSSNEKDFWISQASELLTGLLVCTRVWEAWGVGTMSEDDFISADQDYDTIESMAVNLYNIHNKKVTDLRQIMPPTCTANERKFLDRVRETYKYSPGGRSIYRVNVGYDPTILYPQDFPDIDLKELVNSVATKKEICPLCDEPYDSIEHQTSCQLFG
jgi:hypothetical protein